MAAVIHIDRKSGDILLEDSHARYWRVREQGDALLFETHGVGRRFVGVPRGWKDLAAAELEDYLRAAVLAPT